MVDRIRELCRQKGTSITKLEVSLGFGNGTIGKWKTNTPSYKRLKAVADALGTTVEYLEGAETKKEPTTPEGSELDDLDIQILKIVRNLGQAEKQTLLAGLRTTIANRGSNQ